MSGPFLLGWIVHMLIAQTQCHIFIIVIKLYCTKSAWSVSLGKSRVGWGLRTGWGKSRRGNGWPGVGVGRRAMGQEPRPADSHNCSGPLIGWNSHLEILQQGQPDLAKVRLPFRELQLLLGFSLLGNPARGKD